VVPPNGWHVQCWPRLGQRRKLAVPAGEGRVVGADGTGQHARTAGLAAVQRGEDEVAGRRHGAASGGENAHTTDPMNSTLIRHR